MAGSFNRITLVGNLTRDPEIRYVGSGAAVTKFTLAVNRRSKQQEETDYIDCVAWDKLAETCNTYLKKGMSCLVDGRLSIRSYDDKDGNKRKATEVVVNTMQMLDSANRPDGDRPPCLWNQPPLHAAPASRRPRQKGSERPAPRWPRRRLGCINGTVAETGSRSRCSLSGHPAIAPGRGCARRAGLANSATARPNRNDLASCRLATRPAPGEPPGAKGRRADRPGRRQPGAECCARNDAGRRDRGRP